MPISPHITVLGLGAMGSAFSITLKHFGATVSVLRHLHSPSCPMTLIGPHFKWTHTSYPCAPNQFDWLIIATKAHQVLTALEPYRAHINSSTLIFLIQNGMGVLEAVKQQYPTANIVMISCLFGARSLTNQCVQLSNSPQIKVGTLDPQLNQFLSGIADYFNDHGLNTTLTDDLTSTLQHKLIVNSTLNALGALYNCNHATLMKQHAELMYALCRESTLILNHIGFKPTPDDMWSSIQSLMPAIGENFSSMHQDIQKNRPTEINYINGYLVDVAHQHQVSCMLNCKLQKQIQDHHDTFTDP
ncbi:MAG: hypothetical protein CMF51_01540 [Legionellales bacterium]|nr:hypothetical protein [Legionellales bacterium]